MKIIEWIFEGRLKMNDDLKWALCACASSPLKIKKTADQRYALTEKKKIT